MVYDVSQSTCPQIGSDISAAVGAERDESGASNAINYDGTRLIIGANKEGHTDDHGGNSPTRIYSLVNGDWAIMGSDLGFQGTSGDGTWATMKYDSGVSVAMTSSGDTVAVGASGGPGLVEVYDWGTVALGNDWVKRPDVIRAYSDGLPARFGFSVALSDDGLVLAAGEHQAVTDGGFDGIADPPLDYEGGQVHVFSYDPTLQTWTQVATVGTVSYTHLTLPTI